jgi:polyhydroxyalkanoate synthesis regulator phasin
VAVVDVGSVLRLVEPDNGIGYDRTGTIVTIPIRYQEAGMIDLIKKALYTGVGMAVLTKEKAEELVKELSQQAKLSEQEGKELFDGLLKQSEQARTDFQAKVDDAVLSIVKRLNLASKDELDSLRAKVDELSAKVGQGPGTSATS